MGSILDSAQDIWKRKESPSRKAYNCKKKLEKNKDKGVKMANLERTYNVPLRKEFMKAPKYRRAKKALNALREFLAKHMKSDNVKIGLYLNKKIWERGFRHPPHHVKLTAVKDEKGVVTAELFGAPKPKPKEDKSKKTAEIQKETEELKEALSGEIKKQENAEVIQEKEETPEKEIKTEQPKKKETKEKKVTEPKETKEKIATEPKPKKAAKPKEKAEEK